MAMSEIVRGMDPRVLQIIKQHVKDFVPHQISFNARETERRQETQQVSRVNVVPGGGK